MYRNLDSNRIVETVRVLQRRVEERFPGSGLGNVAAELCTVAEEAAGISDWLAKPQLLLRLLAALGIVLLSAVVITAVVTALDTLRTGLVYSNVAEMLQGLDAAVNEIVFIGIAVFFLVRLETRIKRARALKALHVLRSMAHIIDMHQLTKDPDSVLRPQGETASSPKRPLRAFQLTRYLDYCSEMLAVISKIAALYVQHFNDEVTLSAVNDVENLTTGLSRKIWQKIMILDRVVTPPAGQRQPPVSAGL